MHVSVNELEIFMAVTMSHVAKVAKTSRATVSDVVRGCWKEKGITPATVDRVRKAIKETSYVPNHLAQSMVRGKTCTIGVQVPTMMGKYWPDVVKELDISARGKGYHLILAAPAEFQAEREEILRLCQYQVDGLLISPKVESEVAEVSYALSNQNKPFVFLGDQAQKGDYSVLDDNFQQSSLAVQHLLEYGHKKIAHISGQQIGTTGRERLQGYLNTMVSKGMAVHEGYVQEGKFSIEHAKKAMKTLLGNKQMPTAVYCASDNMALGAAKVILDAGLRIPQDISIVGHGDDLFYEECYQVQLTTICQPTAAMASQAIDMIIRIISGQEVEHKTVKLPGKLIVRNSSGQHENTDN